MPIYLASPMQFFSIKKIAATDKLKEHLESLGFIVGEQVMLISASSENVIIKIKGVSLAIDKGLAKKILV